MTLLKTGLISLGISGISKLKTKSFFRVNVKGVWRLFLLLLFLAGSVWADEVERPWATPGFGLKTSMQTQIDQWMRDVRRPGKAETIKRQPMTIWW